MEMGITGLHIRNFRSLADIHFSPGPINVLFGPNGSGKSNLLDAIWFLRDCLKNGVSEAASNRSHGIGVLWDRALEHENINITIKTDLAEYELILGLSSGRIEAYAGESLISNARNQRLIERLVGSSEAFFYHSDTDRMVAFPLRDGEYLALSKYLDFERSPDEAVDIDRTLHYTNAYLARETDLYRLRKMGSESSHYTHLWERGQNLWSVLRNLHDRRSVDNRYDTIIEFMRKAFPSFRDILLEQTGPNSVYGSFIEKGRKHPILASGVSDGHLQMLTHLTSLFSTGKERSNVLLYDEPETSLHPYALRVLAEAMEHSAKNWRNQIFISTHSPMFVSQFQPEYLFAVGIGEEGQTIVQNLVEIPEIQDLLQEYAVGSLYMAEMIAPQSNGHLAEVIR